MSGITTGVGLVSGIDTASLIQQLLAVEARPQVLAQVRLTQLQAQQAAFLDINTRLGGLQSAARSFRTEDTFSSANAVSSDEDTLSATASTSAQIGTYTFVVDRLVSTQQELSRGFADADVSGLNAGSFTFETADALLERDVALADLNGGSGVRRGELVITDSTGADASVDLSRAGTIQDVIEAINGSGLAINAKAVGDRLVVDDTAGGGVTLTIANGTDSFAATDLGIEGVAAGGRITGQQLLRATELTSLSAINGGTGVERTSTIGSGAFDFTVRVDGVDARVFLGQIIETEPDPDTGEDVTTTTPEAATLGDVVGRINAALQEALGETTTVSAELNASGTELRVVDSAGTAAIEVLDRGEETGGERTQATAAQLGLAGAGAGAIEGSRIFGGLNSVLSRNLNGGAGVAGDGSLTITARDGSVFNISGLTLDGALSDIADEIESQTGGVITVGVDGRGTGIVLTDRSAGVGNLIVEGTAGSDTAASLGIATDPAGVASATLSSGNLQRQYLGAGTLLNSLNNGSGVGTGSFTVRDATGNTATVTIGDSLNTLGDVIDAINATSLAVTARLNDQGDGIVIEEDVDPDTGTPGSIAIRVEDESGGVARALGIEGEASGTEDDNVIDGSFERVIEFEATDTLEDIAQKINDAGVEAAATILNDGSGSTPFRLSLTARDSGSAGRFIVDDGGFGLGLSRLSDGQDARVFFGSDDPATGLLVTSTTNTVDGLVQGVSIDLRRTDEQAVTLTVSRDLGAIEDGIGSFVTAFNQLIGRIDQQTRFVEETEERGPLLGDSTTLTLRQRLFSTIQGAGDGLTGRFTRLSQVGITIGDGGSSLSFDSGRFREAFNEDPASVTALFETFGLTDVSADVEIQPGITVSGGTGTREFDSLGVVGQIEELARSYLDSVDGLLTARERALDDQISFQESRIETFTEALQRRELQLQQEFVQLERVLADLQGQQGALASLAQLG